MQVLRKWIFGNEVDRQNCVFCRIAKNKDQHFHYEDSQYYVITDIRKASAQEHLLVIPKEHIDNALTVPSPSMILQMQSIGEKVLQKICQERNLDRQFRFGFHLPPFNSVDHLHLHCFIEPLTEWKYNKIHYGTLFNSVELVLAKLKKKSEH